MLVRMLKKVGLLKFPNLKDRFMESEKSGLVYEISCRDCDAVYIEKTGCSLKTRKHEHFEQLKEGM